MIKYIGSKRTLVPRIDAIVRDLPNVRRVCDIFAGTTRIGQALKQSGLWVHSNDLATYSEVFGTTYIATDAVEIDTERLRRVIAELMTVSPVHGYITRTFCEDSRYFQPFNGMRMDAIRAGIDAVAVNETERAILLTSLIEAADRVDSTTGLQMAYLKGWSARSFNPLALRVPNLLPGSGAVTRMDANALVRQLDRDIDLVYIDPPYNQHSYFSNYHIWETFVRNDAPPTYGIAMKREDCRTEKSAYNSKKQAGAVFADLLGAIRAPYLLVSFNSEGYFTRDEISALLSQRGYVASVALEFKRYVGAQIGIFNPSGEKVGTISHLRNHEHLFLVGPNRAHVDAVMERVGAPPPAHPPLPTGRPLPTREGSTRERGGESASSAQTSGHATAQSMNSPPVSGGVGGGLEVLPEQHFVDTGTTEVIPADVRREAITEIEELCAPVRVTGPDGQPPE